MEDSLKTWLSGRSMPDAAEKIVVNAPEGLRSIGFPDLVLEKLGLQHHETVVYSLDVNTNRPKSWTDISHLVGWVSEFSKTLKNNRSSLAALELIRGLNEYPITLAKYHVEEAISIVDSALTFALGVDITHPNTRNSQYAVENILIEDSTPLHDIVRQVFTCLFSKCLVRLIVKANHFYSSALTAYLVDLMHQSGSTVTEVNCLGFDRRESVGSEKFTRSLSPNTSSKLSVVAIIFKQTDTFSAAQGIIESYFRELYPNLLILTEEAVYDRFVKDWQRYYSHAVHIGPRLDMRTTVTEELNSRVNIDLEAIDIKAAHKMNGNAINVLKFRTLAELMSLLSHLRKIPFMTVWNDDLLLAREFCSRINQCHEFWLNHIPRSLSERRFPFNLLSNYHDAMSDEMTNIYNSVYGQFTDDVEHLRKSQANFMKKDPKVKSMLLLQAYISVITKFKSLKNGSTSFEAVARLRRFVVANCNKVSESEPELSRVEATLKPVGLAILWVRDESSVKSKAALLEFIFKNLLIGNAVLLVCPSNTLGARFSMDNDHVIPFKMVHEAMLDLARLSLDASIEMSEASIGTRRQCPKNTYAIEILPEMTSDTYEALTIALGSRYRTIWCADSEQVDYWSFK